MPGLFSTLSIFDFRKGIDQFSTIENIPLNASPELRNVEFLRTGELIKRRGIENVDQIFGGDTFNHFAILEKSNQENLVFDGEFFAGIIENDGLIAGTHAKPYPVFSLDSDWNYVEAEGILEFNDVSPAGAYTSTLRMFAGINSKFFSFQDLANFWGGAPTVLGVKHASLSGDYKIEVVYTAVSGALDMKIIVDDFTTALTGYKVSTETLPGDTVLSSSTLSAVSKTTVTTFVSLDPLLHTVSELSHRLRVQFHASAGAPGTNRVKLHSVKLTPRDNSVFVSFYKTAAGAPETRVRSFAGTFDDKVIGSHGGDVEDTAVFDGRLQAMLEGSDNTIEAQRDAYYSIGLDTVVKNNEESLKNENGTIKDFIPPLSWRQQLAVVTKGDLPSFVEYAEVRQAPRLYWAKSEQFPSRFWYSGIRDNLKYKEIDQPSVLQPGFWDVDEASEPINGIKYVGNTLFVSKENKIFAMQIDGVSHLTARKYEIGALSNNAMVKVGSDLYFIGKEGIYVISFDLQILRIDNPVLQEVFNMDTTLSVTGVFDKKRAKVSWLYTDNEGTAKMLSFNIQYGSFVLHTSSAFAEYRNAHYSNLEENPYFLTDDRIYKFEDIGLPTDEGSAIDFSYKTAIIFGKDMERPKAFLELNVFYNGIDAVTDHPFTIVIDRNPLLNDDQIEDQFRFIQINEDVSIGDGTTFFVTDDLAGIPAGDITDSFIDEKKKYVRKRYRYTNIGEAKAIQIEFKDNRATSDFIIFGYTLKIQELSPT